MALSSFRGVPLSTSLVAWSLFALTVFWAVGAYNRLVRLRAEIKTAFAAFDAEITRLLDLLRGMLPPEDALAVSQFDGGSAIWAGLQGALAQCDASLAAARHRPLEAERMGALGAARDALATAWARVQAEDAHDLAGPRVPETLHQRHQALLHGVQAEEQRLAQAVARYNTAIRQFPAVLLALLFRFEPARAPVMTP